MLLSLIRRFRAPQFSEQEIRARLEEILQYEPDEQAMADLAAVIPGFDPAEHMRRWRELVHMVEWMDQLADGAHPGWEDDGREADSDLMREQVEEDVQAELTALSTLPHRRPSPLARLLRRAA